LISRHDACVSARRFRWHSSFEHVRCRCPTRASGQNHFPQNRQGRLSSRVHIAATLTGTRASRYPRCPCPDHAGGGLLLASRPGLLLKSASAFKIAGAQLKNELGLAPLKTLFTRDSKSTVGIQAADLLLGAAMSDWQDEATAGPKLQIRSVLADHLGWPDLRADTARREWKFNIWYFHDPTTGAPREARTRPVKLKVPMPTFQTRSR
jgi:hypothetical protein